jgi:uncharacterized membrane protein
MEDAKYYDMLVSQPTVLYYFVKWLYYECYNDDELAISLWVTGICLYILGVYFDSYTIHALMHLTFVYASILLHDIIKQKIEKFELAEKNEITQKAIKKKERKEKKEKRQRERNLSNENKKKHMIETYNKK